MYCAKCGNKLQDGAKFCGKCGAKVEINEEIITSVNVNEVAKEKTKKNKISWKIVLLIIGILGIIIFVVGTRNKSKTVDEAEDNQLVEQGESNTNEIDLSSQNSQTNTVKQTEIGDVIEFGTYEQDSLLNGSEALEWIVLDEKDGKILLLSRYVIDNKPYHNCDDGVDISDITWNRCSLRNWLNEEFYSEAFDTREQKRIVEVTIENTGGFEETMMGPKTQDMIFLLSKKEVESYLKTDEEREVIPTPYAIEQGVEQKWSENCKWLLRSLGTVDTSAKAVMEDGRIGSAAAGIDEGFGIRPAMWIEAE